MKYLYRIVNILLAAVMFPTVIFSDLLAFRVSTSLFSEVGLQEAISIKFIIDVLTGKETFWYQMIVENASGPFVWPAGLNPIKAHLIATLVCFAIALVACLFIIFWSIFSSKRIPVLVSTAVGIISTIVMMGCFDVVANRIVDGTVNLVSALSASWLANIAGSFVGIDGIMLGGFQNGMIFVFIGLLVWTGAFYLIEIGDPEDEKRKNEKVAKKIAAKKAKAENK